MRGDQRPLIQPESPDIAPPAGTSAATRTRWKDGRWEEGERLLPDETGIALSYNGVSHAVMMGTAADLEDFAVGFTVTEKIVTDHREIDEIEVREVAQGFDVRVWLAGSAVDRLQQRRRRLAGPVGCGLCGIESLTEAMRDVPPVSAGLTITPDMVQQALSALPDQQLLHHATHAVHAAGFWQPGAGLALVREDVGRHNALDKLIGAGLRRGLDLCGGVVLLTSRVSVEMVQKTAIAGVSILVAVSAPTALALRVAEATGITVIAVARADGFELFSHPHRVALTSSVAQGAEAV